ncbi:MAG: response regulator transcription factor [Sphingomonadaceae bacterium]
MTARQVEIMVLVGKGFSNKEIARLLEISPETVKSHLKEIFLRFGLRNRVEAIDFIRQQGVG